MNDATIPSHMNHEKDGDDDDIVVGGGGGGDGIRSRRSRCPYVNEGEVECTTTRTATTTDMTKATIRARWYSLYAMTMANAFHFGAYELARSAIGAVFTSTHTFSSSSSSSSTVMMTLAIGCVSPCSILLLTWHRKMFDRYGPQWSLRFTTMMYAIALSMSAVLLRYSGTSSSAPTTTMATVPSNHTKQYLAQGTIIVIFILKNSFVQLLASQHWSFITGILTTTTSTKMALPLLDSDRWTTIIAGVGSVIATLCGWMVAPLLQFVQPSPTTTPLDSQRNRTTHGTVTTDPHPYDGLTALLMCAASMMMLAAICSDEAYRIAHQYHFAPTGRSNKYMTSKPVSTVSLYQRARNLFRTVPVLYILCYEVLLSQGVSTLISYMFISYTKQSIPQDSDRASHTGKVYGRINFVSGVLQFAILPYVLGRPRRNRQCVTQHRIPNTSNGHTNHNVHTHSLQYPINRFVDRYWLVLPTVLGVAGIVMILMEPTSGLRFDVVTLSFSTMKILEYALRVALVERVYAPLEDDERFLGKEIVGMIANRFGKSFSAIALAVLTTVLPTFFIYAPYVLTCLCMVWFLVSVSLIQLLSQQRKEKVQ